MDKTSHLRRSSRLAMNSTSSSSQVIEDSLEQNLNRFTKISDSKLPPKRRRRRSTGAGLILASGCGDVLLKDAEFEALEVESKSDSTMVCKAKPPPKKRRRRSTGAGLILASGCGDVLLKDAEFEALEVESKSTSRRMKSRMIQRLDNPNNKIATEISTDTSSNRVSNAHDIDNSISQKLQSSKDNELTPRYTCAENNYVKVSLNSECSGSSSASIPTTKTQLSYYDEEAAGDPNTSFPSQSKVHPKSEQQCSSTSSSSTIHVLSADSLRSEKLQSSKDNELTPRFARAENNNGKVSLNSECSGSPSAAFLTKNTQPSNYDEAVAGDTTTSFPSQSKVHPKTEQHCTSTSSSSTIPVLSADSLSERCKELFGSNKLRISRSTTAQIFAYASLLIELRHPELKFIIFSSTFLNMLESFVNVETTIIDHSSSSSSSTDDIQYRGDDDDFSCTRKQSKRIRFCAFSSITPPTDIKIGSHRHQERCIEALLLSVEKVDELCSSCGLDSNEDKEEKQQLLNFFKKLADTLGSLEESSQSFSLRQAFEQQMTEEGDDCAGKLLWSESSFHKVVRRHRIEMEEIHAFLLLKLQAAHNTTATITTGESEAFISSPMRKQLGEQIGAAIRFHLRRLLNPVPQTSTNTDSIKLPNKFIDYSNCRSRVYQLVRMVTESANRDTVSAEGVISSVFNLAIRYIYSYFDFNANTIVVVSSSGLSATPITNTSSLFAEIGINTIVTEGKTSSYPVFPADYDVSPVLDRIKGSHDAIATGHACKFITGLLGWPGIVEAINDVGGWGPIEKLASILSKHNLENICPENAHFQILNNVHFLTEKLKLSMTSIDETMIAVEDGFGVIWERFNCGTKKKTWLRHNPAVIAVRDATLGDEVVFPSLDAPLEEGES